MSFMDNKEYAKVWNNFKKYIEKEDLTYSETKILLLDILEMMEINYIKYKEDKDNANKSRTTNKNR